MLARHLFRIGINLEFIHTNSTRIRVRIHNLRSDHNIRQAINCPFRSRGSSISIRVILSELLDQLLKPGAQEIVPEVRRKAKIRVTLIIFDDELNICAALSKMLEMILEKIKGIESGRRRGRRREKR